MWASPAVAQRRAEFCSVTQLRREAAEVLKRLSPPQSWAEKQGAAGPKIKPSCSALIGMDLEHAIALST